MRLLGNISKSDTKPAKNGDPSEIPSGAKQVGSVEPSLRIYMEDYVHTYLYRFAKTNASREKLAVLMGNIIQMLGCHLANRNLTVRDTQLLHQIQSIVIRPVTGTETGHRHAYNPVPVIA